ncbi:Hypothetical protein PSEBR_m1665 [Pseudomonas brassicacearum subsp. brassicacearum NFM421]|uniref:Uncharacterized protein n=1 Tax=Pseudomonas brassicacearum (strain NFM421) TaxID=994484 RepID=F2K630_PSEBN|nr:Hypothetical protein PSEBR_m1665 [Pseudomonas brassicacearum subsp. brassicacearum NFM421]
MLAIAIDQLASALDVPLSSRASFAPTDLTGVQPQEPGRLSGRLAMDVDLRRPVNHVSGPYSALPKVNHCKGGTISRRHPKNGYTPKSQT